MLLLPGIISWQQKKIKLLIAHRTCRRIMTLIVINSCSVMDYIVKNMKLINTFIKGGISTIWSNQINLKNTSTDFRQVQNERLYFLGKKHLLGPKWYLHLNSNWWVSLSQKHNYIDMTLFMSRHWPRMLRNCQILG